MSQMNRKMQRDSEAERQWGREKSETEIKKGIPTEVETKIE